MSTEKYTTLEKNSKFKSHFVPKSIWKKNFIYLLAPIILLLFTAFSLIYIYEAGKLASLMAIPYVVVFVISVVFLRLSKNYVVKKEVSTEGKYLVCLAKVLKEEGRSIYVVFSKGNRRHDKYLIGKYAEQLEEEDLPELNVRDQAYPLESGNDCLYVKKFRKKDFIMKKIKSDIGNVFTIMYVDDANVLLISNENDTK